MTNPKFQLLLDHFPDYIRTVLVPDPISKNFYNCPFCGSGTHGDRSTGALNVDFDKKTWHCFACGEGGGMLQLCMRLNHLANTKKAFSYLCKLYHLEEPAGMAMTAKNDHPEQVMPGQKPKETKLTDYSSFFRECRENMDKGGYEYLASRGIPAALGDRFYIGFAPRWEHPKNAGNDKHYYTPRLIIPLGRYAYLARDTRPGKNPWAKLKGGKLQDFFFGQKAMDNPVCFFVVEGEMDCLSFYAAGAVAVALGSVARVNTFLAVLAKKKPSGTCLIALDNDDAGKSAAEKLAAGCKELNILYRIIPSVNGNYKDPNEYLSSDSVSFKKEVRDIIKRIRTETATQKNE